MKYFLGFVAGVAFVIALAAWLPDQEEKYYDCSMSEWHPDFPPKVREECRKLRSRSRITT